MLDITITNDVSCIVATKLSSPLYDESWLTDYELDLMQREK